MKRRGIGGRTWLAIAGVLVGCSPEPEVAAPQSGPPLFVATQGTSRVYVFGGAVPRDRSWLSASIDAAIEESQELWQEEPATPCPFDQALNIELGTRANGQLFDDLDPDQEARVLAVAERMDIPLDRLQIMRPWGVGAVIASLDYARHMAEYSPDDIKGTIQKRFEDRGLPVRAEVEECGDNVRFYAGFSEPAAVQNIMYQIDLAELPPELFPRWSEEWLRGDTSGWLGFNRQLAMRYPDLYAVLEVGRNEAWARRIRSMLDRGGTFFVFVGIQHTLGPDSIQEKATALGISVESI
jgi:uncharacterized protein YbaP (TraB family)